MSRISWLMICRDYEKVIDEHEGPNSMKVQLAEYINDPSCGKKFAQDCFIELEADKYKSLKELWKKSGWTSAEFDDELNCRLDSKKETKFSCGKFFTKKLSDGFQPRCVLEKNHDESCRGYGPIAKR